MCRKTTKILVVCLPRTGPQSEPQEQASCIANDLDMGMAVSKNYQEPETDTSALGQKRTLNGGINDGKVGRESLHYGDSNFSNCGE